MVASAGVNEGTPQEPVKAEAAPVELTDTKPAAPVPAQAVSAQAVPAQAVPAQAVPAQAVPVETVPAQAVPVETVAAQAVPAQAVPAQAGPVEVPAEPEAAGTAVAEAEAAGAEAAGAELAEAGEPGWEAEEESRDVSALAVVGIIFGVIALVGVAVGVLAVVTHGFRPKTVVTYRPAAVFGLRPGECVNIGTNDLSVTVLSCTTPHDAEVFATFALPAGAWAGAAAVQQDASNGCNVRLSSYLNPQLATADLTQEYVYPNQAAWRAGERTVVCEVSAVSGQLTGSVRASS